jgi:hypothetical protein
MLAVVFLAIVDVLRPVQFGLPWPCDNAITAFMPAASRRDAGEADVCRIGHKLRAVLEVSSPARPALVSLAL